MNNLFYESRPYAYGIIAALAYYYNQGSGLALMSCCLLVFCMGIVFKMRYEYRKAKQNTRR